MKASLTAPCRRHEVALDEVFESDGVEIIPLLFQAPRADAFAERWVGSARRELPDRVLIFGRGHLEVMTESIDHYNHARPHQGIEQRGPSEPAELV